MNVCRRLQAVRGENPDDEGTTCFDAFTCDNEFPNGAWLLPAVDDVGFSVFPREIVAVVGESGSGKTVTCLSVIGLAGASAVTTGSIVFDGRELVGLPSDELPAGARRRDRVCVSGADDKPQSRFYRIGNQLDETLRAHTKLSKEQRKQPYHTSV